LCGLRFEQRKGRSNFEIREIHFVCRDPRDDLSDRPEELPLFGEPLLEQQRRRRGPSGRARLHQHEEDAVALPVPLRTVHRLVPLRPQVLQG
jgi:hypothetical protein